jgi:MYXO-CTERM domain-containing protein
MNWLLVTMIVMSISSCNKKAGDEGGGDSPEVTTALGLALVAAPAVRK